MKRELVYSGWVKRISHHIELCGLPSSLHVLSLTLLVVCVPMGVEDLDSGKVTSLHWPSIRKKRSAHSITQVFSHKQYSYHELRGLLNPTLVGEPNFNGRDMLGQRDCGFCLSRCESEGLEFILQWLCGSAAAILYQLLIPCCLLPS